MSDQQRADVLAKRQRSRKPWHSVPFIDSGPASYMVTAACYEHRPHIGFFRRRMDAFCTDLLQTISGMTGLEELIAWVVLPNHYHLLGHFGDIAAAKRDLGRLHGRTSHLWNSEERAPGRKVWFRAAETVMKNERHYWATVNYIHHNPVKHRCVALQSEWPWSSFGQWEHGVGRDDLIQLWKQFPINEYGKGWDDEDLSHSVPLE